MKLPPDPMSQLEAAIAAMQAAAPDLPLLISLMSPYDLATRSLRARLISRDPETGQVGVVGQRLRSRLIGDAGSRVTGEMVLPRLETILPGLHEAVSEAATALESTFHQIMEFDISVSDQGWHLIHIEQATPSPDAALALAVDLQKNGHLSETEALSRLSAADLESLLHPTVDPEAERDVLCQGFAAAPGAVAGALVFGADEALERAKRARPLFWPKQKPSPMMCVPSWPWQVY